MTIKNQYKSIWISDLHLGTSGCKADLLCQFLKNNDCENLFLVGDIIDGWRLRRSWYWPQSHSNVIRRILTKAKRGTQIYWILGNHDEFARPWLKYRINLGNLKVCNNFTYVDTKNRNWLITHGDLFDQVTRHYRWVSLLGDWAYSCLLWSNQFINRVRRACGWGYWSFSQFVKHRTKQAVNFICKFEENLANHANDTNHYGVICGHIHTPAIKDIAGTVYINTGDWVETCSAVVETLSGDFLLLKLTSGGNMEVIGQH